MIDYCTTETFDHCTTGTSDRRQPAHLCQRGAGEQVGAHEQTILDDNAPSFQHAFAGHDVEQTLEALLERYELLHLEVAVRQLR